MDLFIKAAEAGIQTGFIDVQGQRRVTDAAALQAILDAFPARRAPRFVDGPVVLRSGQPARTALRDAVTLPLRWKIVADLKVIAQGDAVDRTITWPNDLPIGCYRLDVTDAASQTEEVAFLVAPPKAFDGEFDRSWLLAVQLYGVKSS